MINERDDQIVTDSTKYIDFSLLTAIGNRKEQQDSYGYLLKDNRSLVVVCDGMGGKEKGRDASRLSVTEFLERFERFEGSSSEIIGFLKSTAMLANETICRFNENNKTSSGSGSTSVAIVLDHQNLYWLSVGDTRAYLIRGKEMVQFTIDQNYRKVLEEQMHAGKIDRDDYEDEIINGDMLVAYLGLNELEVIDYNKTPVPLRANDKIVILTDGFYRVLSNEEVRSIVTASQSPEDACIRLKERCLKVAKEKRVLLDNFTAAIIKIKSSE